MDKCTNCEVRGSCVSGAKPQAKEGVILLSIAHRLRSQKSGQAIADYFSSFVEFSESQGKIIAEAITDNSVRGVDITIEMAK